MSPKKKVARIIFPRGASEDEMWASIQAMIQGQSDPPESIKEGNKPAETPPNPEEKPGENPQKTS